MTPPPGRLARAQSVDVRESGNPPVADLTYTEVVSPPVARRRATNKSKSTATPSLEMYLEMYLTKDISETFGETTHLQKSCHAVTPRQFLGLGT